MTTENLSTEPTSETAQRRHDNSETAPSVSVIIPARGAHGTIAECLRGLARQDYQGPVEVVIAEADDPEGMSELAASFLPIARVVPNPRKETVFALQTAIKATSGEYVVRCDAHAILPPDYISTAVATLKRTGAANVGGRQVAAGDTFLQRGIAMAMNTWAGTGGAVHRSNRSQEGPADTAYLGSFSRKLYDSVGGFSQRYIRNEDYELNWRFRGNGLTVWFDPDLVVHYSPRSSLPALVRQYFRYGRSKSRLIAEQPRSARLRHLAAPLFVLSLAASALLGVLGQTLPVIAILVLYSALLLATTVAHLITRKDPAALLLPIILPAMHLSWGTGFFVPARRLPSLDCPPNPPGG